MSTFPQIFYQLNNKKYKIGGNDDFKKKLNYCIFLGNSINKSNIHIDLHITQNIFKKNKTDKIYKKSKIYKILNKLIKITK